MKALAHRLTELERAQHQRPASGDTMQRILDKLAIIRRNMGDVEPRPDPPTPEQIAGIRVLLKAEVERMHENQAKLGSKYA